MPVLPRLLPPLLGSGSNQTVDTLVSFGDSYTCTQIAGLPTSYEDGPVWITRAANATNTRLINYAFPAATVDRRVATVLNDPGFDGVPDMLTQVSSFLTDHGGLLGALDAVNPNTTQVSIWFGGNDTNGTSYRDDPHEYHERIMDSYLNATESLYDWGAKRFLFTNIPDIWRAHYGIDAGPERQQKLRDTIDDFNQVLGSRLDEWCSSHSDVLCTRHDLKPAFNDMMDNPSKFDFVDGTSYCPAYTQFTGVFEDDRQTSPCAPLPNYMWLNPLHLTWKSHVQVAKSALNALGISS